MKKIKLINLFFLFLVYIFILIILPSIIINRRSGANNLVGNRLIPLTAVGPVSFQFSSDRTGLDKLILTLKNPGLVNNSPIHFTINSPSSVREVSFSGFNIGDPSNLDISFTPFTDPAGTNFQVTITTDNQDDRQLYVYTNDSGLPVFQTFYRQGSLGSRLAENWQRQLTTVSSRSTVSNTIYYLILLLLIGIYLWR